MTSPTDELVLDRETIGRFDPTDQLTDVLAIPEHLRDALWKVESAGLDRWDSTDGLVVAGMGGSAIGGQLSRAILGDHASRPILGARAYGLPPWTTHDTTVLCASLLRRHRGDAGLLRGRGRHRRPPRRRRPAAASSPRWPGPRACPCCPVAGGFQPRAAVAYMTVAVLEVAALCGVSSRMNSEIDVAADHLEDLVEEWGPEGAEDGLAKSIARALNGTVPVIAGAGLTTPIAYRWKTQINENAKSPAFAAELPELDHNEIEGWSSAADHGRFSAVFLDDADTHPRVRERIDLTAELIAPGAAQVLRAESRGQTAVERVFSLVLLGDLVSLYMAVLRGIDPQPVELLGQLKAQLTQD